jgi:uncharacterized protein
MSGYFTIPISGLKPGRHIYDFEINNEFFDKFEESEVKEGDLKAILKLKRDPTHIDLEYKNFR